jgi:phosphoserine phosphatase
MNIFLIVALVAGLGTSEAAQKKSAVIFDLDDTLVETRYRSYEILRQIAVQQNLPQLLNLTVDTTDYYCTKSLSNVGLTDATIVAKVCGESDWASELQSLWGKKFHANPASIPYDHMLAGAPLFVNALVKDLGVQVIYLTGRNQEATARASQAQLNYYGFPKGPLITKPTAYTGPDEEFKRQELRRLLQTYNVVAVFDDSLKNANMFRAELPLTVPVVRPTRTPGDPSGVSAGIDQIRDYLAGEPTLRSVVERAKKLKKPGASSERPS